MLSMWTIIVQNLTFLYILGLFPTPKSKLFNFCCFDKLIFTFTKKESQSCQFSIIDEMLFQFMTSQTGVMTFLFLALINVSIFRTRLEKSLIWQKILSKDKYTWYVADLVPFVQFKKHKKHPWRSVTFSKATLLKVALFHGCFTFF